VQVQVHTQGCVLQQRWGMDTKVYTDSIKTAAGAVYSSSKRTTHAPMANQHSKQQGV